MLFVRGDCRDSELRAQSEDTLEFKALLVSVILEVFNADLSFFLTF